jgi:hypothetical protein
MSAINLLDEVIDELEQNDNVMRIKRLILFTCHDFWVSDTKELQDVDLRELVQELLAVVPSLNRLKLLLNSHVKKLSKPGAYLLAADVIIDTVGQLYTHHSSDMLSETEDTGLLTQEALRSVQVIPPPPLYADKFSSPDAHQHGLQTKQGDAAIDFNLPPDNTDVLGDVQSWQSRPDPAIAPLHKDPPPPAQPTKLDYIVKPFDLRYEIASNISPLRAKVLIFSALHYKFNPRDRDWAQIGSHDLDDLLLELFQTCETFENLESKLYETAHQLDDLQENEQAASLICGAMRSLYP